MFFLSNTLSVAQFPHWDWAKSNGMATQPNGFANAITVTNNNQIYCVGQFNSQTISFGAILLANEDNYYKNDDIFIACYSILGEVLWAKSMGGDGDDVAKSIAADKSGNIYITGSFTSTKIGFGKDTLYNIGQAGTNDAFIAQYSSAGEEVWAKAIGGSHDDKSNSISVDIDNNLYITGSFFSGKLFFQKGDTVKNADPSGSSTDIFLAKYSNEGACVWTKSINGSSLGYDYGYAITTDVHKNVFVTGGSYSNQLRFDSITISNSPFNNGKEDSIRLANAVYKMIDDKGNLKDTIGIKGLKKESIQYIQTLPPEKRKFEKIFIAKYAESGKLQWAQIVGGSDDEEGSAIATDANDNVFITGRFQSSSMTLETITMENKGSNDIFIAKYDKDGRTLWAKSVGGISDDRGNAITVDNTGSIYIAGWFGSPKAIFGKSILNNSGGKGYTDMFIAKYDTFGNALWAENAKGKDSEWTNCVAVDRQGNIYLAGGFDSPEMNLGNIKLTNGKKKSFFISKIYWK